MYDAADAGLDQIIDRTRANLLRYRAEHDDEDEGFIQNIVREFCEQAAKSPHGAGAISMALSAYRLAVQQIEIDELSDMVEMRDEALEFLWAIRDQAEQEGTDG